MLDRGQRPCGGVDGEVGADFARRDHLPEVAGHGLLEHDEVDTGLLDAETHLDPPAASVVLTPLPLGLPAMAGVLPSDVWVPTP